MEFYGKKLTFVLINLDYYKHEGLACVASASVGRGIFRFLAASNIGASAVLMERAGRGRGGEAGGREVFFPLFPSPFSPFFALAPIFSREKCFQPSRGPTGTLATQAKVWK